MIKVKPSKCTGCRRCEIVCSMVHYQRIDPYRRRIRIASEWPWKEQINVCRMCKKPQCVASCPTKALSKTPKGPIHLDRDVCVGCFSCVEACPFGSIWQDEENKTPLVCDACNGAYSCVKWCHERVLQEVN